MRKLKLEIALFPVVLGICILGILIGWVSGINHEPHELFKTARLDSAVDFNQIEEVFAILPSKSDSNLSVE